MLKAKYFRRFTQFLIGLSFFMPLIVIPSSYIFPFIVPKVVAFRSIVLLMLGSYILLLVSNWQRYKPKVSWLNVGVFLFILSFAISTFAGVDPFRSFWDNHERMLGLFSVMHYVLFYYIVSATVEKWSEWRWVLRTFTVGAGLVMVIAFLQKYIDPKMVLNQGSGSVHSTLGNPIYLGGYGFFLAFLGALLYTKDKASHYWNYWYIATILLGLFGIYSAGQRGPFLGLVAGIAIGVYVYAWIYRENKSLKNLAIYGTLAGLVLVGGLYYYRDTNFVKNIPIVGPTVNVDPSEGTLNTRLLAWGSALEATKDRPIFGWGPRNFYYGFNQYFKPEMMKHGYGETWFDNAHNIVMETLATRGAFGILTYLALFIAVFVVLAKGYREGNLNAHEVALISAFTVGHFVHNVLVFEDPTSYLYFFFTLAYVNQRGTRSREEVQVENNNRISYGLTTAVVGVSVLLVYMTNIQPAQANTSALNTLRDIQRGNNGLESYKQTLSIPSPHRDVIVTDVAQSVLGVIPKYKKAEKSQAILLLVEKVYSDLNEVIKQHPLEIRSYIKKSQLAQQLAQLKQDPSYINEAEQALETALKHSPKRQQLQFMLSNIKLRLGKKDEAEQQLKNARDNYRKLSEPWWRLALFYQQQNKTSQAKEVINKAKEEGIEFSGQGQKVIQQIEGQPQIQVETSSSETSSKN